MEPFPSHMSPLTQFKEAGRGDWEQRPDVVPGGVAGALAVPIVVLRYQEALPFSSLSPLADFTRPSPGLHPSPPQLLSFQAQQGRRGCPD